MTKNKSKELYAIVETERGLSKAEASIYFGKEQKKNYLVPSSELKECYKDRKVLKLVKIKPLANQSNKYNQLEAEIKSISGKPQRIFIKQEYVRTKESLKYLGYAFDVSPSELRKIRKKEVDNIRATSKKPEEIKKKENGLYLEVNLKGEYRYGKRSISFDQKLLKKCMVHEEDLFMKNKKEGLLKVTLEKKTEDFNLNPERKVDVIIELFGIGKEAYGVSSRYLHKEKPIEYK